MRNKWFWINYHWVLLSFCSVLMSWFKEQRQNVLVRTFCREYKEKGLQISLTEISRTIFRRKIDIRSAYSWFIQRDRQCFRCFTRLPGKYLLYHTFFTQHIVKIALNNKIIQSLNEIFLFAWKIMLYLDHDSM